MANSRTDTADTADTADTTEGVCQRIESLLPWHINGTLSLDEIARVKEHLVGCSSCREVLLETESVMTLVAKAERARQQTVAPAVVRFPTVSPEPVRRRPRMAPGLLRLAAAVLLSLLLGYGAGLHQSTSSEQLADLKANDSGQRVAVGAASSDQYQQQSSPEIVTIEGFENGSLEGSLRIRTQCSSCSSSTRSPANQQITEPESSVPLSVSGLS